MRARSIVPMVPRTTSHDDPKVSTVISER